MPYIRQYYKNNAVATLAVELLTWPSATTVSLTTWDWWLMWLDTPFKCIIYTLNEVWDRDKQEIVNVTNISWDILTVERAFEECPQSATAQTQTQNELVFPAWSFIEVVNTAEQIAEVSRQIAVDDDTTDIVHKTGDESISWSKSFDADFFQWYDESPNTKPSYTDFSFATKAYVDTSVITAWLPFIFGDGSDWDLVVASWTTNINAWQIYNFNSINIAWGATLSTTDDVNIITSDQANFIIKAKEMTLDGVIDLSWKWYNPNSVDWWLVYSSIFFDRQDVVPNDFYSETWISWLSWDWWTWANSWTPPNWSLWWNWWLGSRVAWWGGWGWWAWVSWNNEAPWWDGAQWWPTAWDWWASVTILAWNTWAIPWNDWTFASAWWGWAVWGNTVRAYDSISWQWWDAFWQDWWDATPDPFTFTTAQHWWGWGAWGRVRAWVTLLLSVADMLWSWTINLSGLNWQNWWDWWQWQRWGGWGWWAWWWGWGALFSLWAVQSTIPYTVDVSAWTGWLWWSAWVGRIANGSIGQDWWDWTPWESKYINVYKDIA